uniref:Uncharacterized protein n=1 Tax=viral metagenome TaxID=1070528 RepID=A0A6C0KX17_9ZZZZ
MGKKIQRSPYIVNSATGMVTEDKRETLDEKKYFRVMPLDMSGNGVEKLYFDSKEQYQDWRSKYINEDKYKSVGIINIPGLNSL